MKQRPFILILILGALTTISPFAIDMYLPAFQQIAKDFNSSVSSVSLSLSSYFVGLAIGQVLYGPCLDRFGRKPPLYFGLTIFILASIACMFSNSIEMLVACRFVQALGGCVASVAAVAMVRDFFPVKEGAKVFSRLMLILSVSPLFAPTVGGYVTSLWGWKTVFLFLAVIVLLISLIVFFFLPEGHEADPDISLNPKDILKEFGVIFKDRQFFSFAVGGAFSFAGLFVYLAGAPSIFLNTFKLDERAFGIVFAFLSIGIIGGGQLNIFLTKFFSSQKIFRTALLFQLATACVFTLGAFLNWFDLYGHVAMFFVFLSCVGLTYPNAATMALAPFKKNAGSASALMGSLQMAVGALSAAAFGLFNFSANASMGILFIASSAIGGAVYFASKTEHLVESSEDVILGH